MAFCKCCNHYQVLYFKSERVGGLKVDQFCFGFYRFFEISNSLQRFLLAVSWGGHESLVFPATASSEKDSDVNRSTVNLVRIYIGLESPETLIEDLEQAMDKFQS